MDEDIKTNLNIIITDDELEDIIRTEVKLKEEFR